jgi:hypothetical protein
LVGVTVLLAVVITVPALAASAKTPELQVDPGVPEPLTGTHVPVSPQVSPWVPLNNAAPFNPGAMLLLTNGSVLMQDQGPSNSGSGNWWLLTPDAAGSYQDGTWSQVASLPAGYAPYAFASAVLPDSRVIIEGGEENGGQYVWTNLGAIYNPSNNTWTPVSPPARGSGEWVRIGDAPSTVLSTGKFMLGASGFSGTTAQAILNAASLTWKSTGMDKADGNGEEGWSLLPNGKVLTVDTTDTSPQNSEIYDPTTGSWSSAGTVPVMLADAGGEMGPQILMPNGTVLATGASGSNALYDYKTGTWTAATPFPVIGGQQYDIADGAAAILPDGNVLMGASPGEYQSPTQFFVYSMTKGTLNKITNPPNASNASSYYYYMLVLPNGQILSNDRVGDLDLYTAGGAAQASWAPTISSVPTVLAPGSNYNLTGKQLNGLTQGAAYGDDFQDATNYPLVRLTYQSTGQVLYAPTSGMTSMSVKAKEASSTNFMVPAGAPAGAADLVVVANGIASAPVAVTIS